MLTHVVIVYSFCSLYPTLWMFSGIIHSEERLGFQCLTVINKFSENSYTSLFEFLTLWICIASKHIELIKREREKH